MSVIPYPHPIERALRLAPNGTLKMDNPQHVATRSQDLQPSFHDAGQFYWGVSAAWISGSPILSGETKAVVLEHTDARDIDNEQDWHIAEQLFSLRANQPSAVEVT
jgi:N-acylneuraminate cytidylyltransferase